MTVWQINPEQVKAWFESNVPNNGKPIRWNGADALTHSPLREDRSPSFSINYEKGTWHDLATGDKGGIVALAQRLNADPPECFQKRREAPNQRTHEGTFIYTDERGNPLLKIERYREPSGDKKFFQKTMVDGSWRNGGYQKTTGTPNPLYRLDEIHDNPTAAVYIHEGEIKVDRAKKWNLPGVATCWPGGAQGIGKADFSPLHGRDVVLVPDNDGPGKEAMAKIAALLSGKVKSIKVATYPENFPHKGDICDCASPEEARAILATAKPWAGAVELPEEKPKRKCLSKTLAELRALPPAVPLIEGLLPEGEISLIYGQPASGKTFMSVDIALHIACGLSVWHEFPIRKSGPVLYLSGEGRGGILDRIDAWAMRNRIKDVDNSAQIKITDTPVSLTDDAGLEAAMYEVDTVEELFGELPVLIVVDTVARHFGGQDENSTQAMNALVSNIDKLKAHAGRCAVLLNHHCDKKGDSYRGNSALMGAQENAYFCSKNGNSITLDSRHPRGKRKDLLGPDVYQFSLVDHEIRPGKTKGAPEFNGTATAKSPQEILSLRERLVLDCVREAAGEHGVLSADGSFIGVHIDHWRPLFMDRCQANSETEEKRKSAKSSALSRAMGKLCREDGSGVLVQENDMYRFSDDLKNSVIAATLRSKKETCTVTPVTPVTSRHILSHCDGDPPLLTHTLSRHVTHPFRGVTCVTMCDKEGVTKKQVQKERIEEENPKQEILFPENEKSSSDLDSSSSNSGILKGDFDFSFFDDEEELPEETAAPSNPVEPAASIPPETQSWYSSLPEADREAIRSRGEKLLAFPDISPEDRERVFGQLVEVALIESRSEGVFPSEVTVTVCDGDDPEEDDPGPETEVFPGIGENPELVGAALSSIPSKPEPLPPPEAPSPRASPPPSEGKREALYFPPSVKGLTWTLKNFYLEKNAEARRAGDGDEEARKWAEEMTLKKASSGEEIQR